MAAAGGKPRPTGPIANKGLELLASNTPNSHKIIILLEELKSAYPGIEVTYNGIDLRSGVQKEPWFLALNSNGKAPVLIDHDDDFVLPESQAIAAYLLQKYDSKRLFSFSNPKDIITTLRWTSWGIGEVGPAAVQAIDFYRFYRGLGIPTKKTAEEFERCLSVLEKTLASREYLVGEGRGKYSVADVFSFPFVYSTSVFGVDHELKQWPNVKAWADRISARPALANVFVTPWVWGWDAPTYARKLKDNPEFAAQEEALQKILVEARAAL